nr:adenylyl-sulfate kinase [Selenihalanaerobacter shriftii]
MNKKESKTSLEGFKEDAPEPQGITEDKEQVDNDSNEQTVNRQPSTVNSTTSSKNIMWHEGKVTYEDRCKNLTQNGVVVWFTGLSGSGKSTIAVEVEKELLKQGKAVYRLDGDNVRHGLNSDLGFAKEDRDENIRRIAEVAALFKDAGLITLASFISPFQEMRDFARERAGEDSFIEIYVKADVPTCAERDPKGLYQKAKQGEIDDFTGVSSPYETPETSDVIIDTDKLSIGESVQKILEVIANEQ